MNWLIGDYTYSAYQSLRRSRTRTLLTMLGVAIGVCSVTAIFALSQGLTDVINRQLDKLGGNLIVISPGSATPTTALANPATQQNYTTSTLSKADVTTIAHVPGVAAVAPLVVQTALLKADNRSLENTVVVATTPALETVSKLALSDGEFLAPDTPSNRIVLGHQLAINLFGTDRPIGLTLAIRGESYMVTGVLAASLDPVNYNHIDIDNAAFVTLSAGTVISQGRGQIQQIDARATNTDQLGSVSAAIQAAILQNHGGENDFTVSSGTDISKNTSDFMRTAALVLAAIAAISLVVGGVGIMNILLVGVAERTREIGIRKSVGATSTSIALQFLIESIMMSVMGGFLGYLLGYVVAFGVSTYLYFVPSVNWQVAVAALAMSVGVGILFGFYPALRAARKHPIESLRQYH